jgi:hypothetical protein
MKGTSRGVPRRWVGGLAVWVALGLSSGPDRARAAAPADDPAYVVAPNGRDDAAGSEAAPFATIQRAVEAMRSSTVKRTLLRGGLHSLRGQTVTLGPRDHGVQLLNFPGERPVLSGGWRVQPWTRSDASKGIWSAPLPEGLDGVGAVTVNGDWYEPARTPNRDPDNPQGRSNWFVIQKSLGPKVNPWEPSFNGDKSFTYRGNDLPPALNFQGEPNAWVQVWDKLGWSADPLPIKSIDHATRTVTLGNASQFGLGPNSRYFVYGLRSALDAGGEYYVDQASRTLLLIPKKGVQPDEAVVCAARYNGGPLIAIDGADRVRVSGLEFRDQHNTARWGVPMGGGVRILSGKQALIDGNRFHALGVAVTVEDAATDVMVKKNEAYDLGCSGIVMLGTRNTLLGNSIHDVGLVEQSSKGIVAGPGRNIVAHNSIRNVPHYGIISGNDKADGLIIEYNVLENCNQGTNDAGVIYLKNRGTFNARAREQVRYNLLKGSGGLTVDPETTAFTQGGTFTFGVYLDDGQSGTDVYGNVMIGVSSGAVFPHNGADNHIYNNLFINALNEQLFLETSSPATNVFERNIFYTTNPKPTIVTKAQGQENVLRNNLFFHAADAGYFGRSFYEWGDGKKMSYDAALGAGFHTGSKIADPLFVNPAAGDYRLKPESPAYGLGFTAIPFEQIGPASVN